MEMNNQLKSYAIIALMSSGVTLGAYSLFNLGNTSGFSDAPSAFTTSVSNQIVPGNPGEFTYAAEKTTPAVVHIKTKMETRQRQQQFSLTSYAIKLESSSVLQRPQLAVRHLSSTLLFV